MRLSTEAMPTKIVDHSAVVVVIGGFIRFWQSGGGMATGWASDVLLVDDEPSITELLRRLLEADCQVREVHGVCEALEAMSARQPDLVVTDLGMDGGGGKYLLAVIADEYPGVRRLIYSAAPISQLACLIAAGLADAAVSKSEPWPTVVNEVRRLLAESTVEAAMDPVGAVR